MRNCWPWQFDRHTLQIYRIKLCFKTQLSIINISLLTPNYVSNVYEYFKDNRPNSTNQSLTVLSATYSDI